MGYDVTGKRVLLTGGSSGIGAELVAALLDGLARELVQAYAPANFAELASGKAANVEGFLSGSAERVHQQQSKA